MKLGSCVGSQNAQSGRVTPLQDNKGEGGGRVSAPKQEGRISYPWRSSLVVSHCNKVTNLVPSPLSLICNAWLFPFMGIKAKERNKGITA
ncbi:hypothetical protein J1N35_011446 [Gossypium stocksii]|uniref:Uncharacterized protein n=1 Tax=Gossypium stocksii TaxID=47602 RepID=A0A9D3W3I6_9ROSI|nr:hypothetical protein J1N35_011446 [Gossypium stocksii]